MSSALTVPFDRVSVTLASDPVMPSMGTDIDEIIDIYPEQSPYIDFGATGVAEVFQNVKYILLTTVYSVPLDREFGIDANWVDKPMNVAEYMIAQETALKIHLYEPRARFRDISFTADIDVKLSPNITIDVDLSQPLGARAIPPTFAPGDELARISVSPSGEVTVSPAVDMPPWITGPTGPPGKQGIP